jgi:hypothetical protein
MKVSPKARLVVLQARVDADRVRGVVGQVAQHALGQAQILVQQRARRRVLGAFADPGPGLAQVGDVVGQFGVGRVLGVGAQDEAAGLLAGQRVHARAQLLAQLVRADLLRDADVVVVRQKNQHASGHRDLRRQPRALAADRVLDHLHGERLALEHLALDRHGRRLATTAAGIERRIQVGHVEERGAIQPDVDEGALHARQHACHLAQVDVADQAALERALDVQLLHRAVLDDGHARFLRSPVDEDVLAGHGGLDRQRKLELGRAV